MPVFVTLYIAYSIMVVGIVCSKYLLKGFDFTLFERYLIGFAILSYTAMGFMVSKSYPHFPTVLHGATLLCTLLLAVDQEVWSLKGIQTYFNQRIHFLLPGLLISILAFYFRLPVSNFIYEIGDAGGYVNSANHLVWSGTKSTQFFPLVQLWMAVFSALAGKAYTAWATPFFSVHAVVVVFFLCFKVFNSVRTALIAMILLASNILAIWFGRLPYSESLMTFLNLTLLYLCYGFIEEDISIRKKYVLLVPLFVGLAALTRVTGIVWMAAISLNLTYQLLVNRKSSNEQLLLFCASFLLYSLSMVYGLVFAKMYYIEWQLKSYIPFLNTPRQIIVFHCVWLLTGIGFYLAALYIRYEHLADKLCAKLNRHEITYSVIAFFGLLLMGNFLVLRDPMHLFPVAFLKDLLSERYPQDAYYLYHFFGVVSWIIFPMGLIYIFRDFNPIKKPRIATLWFFALGYLVIYYSRVVHHRPHAVYLYYLRYFLSEILLVYLIIVTAGIHRSLDFKTPITKALQGTLGGWRRLVAIIQRFGYSLPKAISILFIAAYGVHSAQWLHKNQNVQYLENAYEILAEIESVIPRQKSVIFSDIQYDGKWVYPNFGQCFLYPLKHSFGYRIGVGAKTDNPYHVPFSKDHLNRVVSNPDKPLTAYVLAISRNGIREPLDVSDMPGIVSEHLKRIKSYVMLKGHNPGNIIHKNSSRHDIAIDIWEMKRFYVFPYKGRFIKRSGFYRKSIWTKDSGTISGFKYKINKHDNYIILGTYGYNPLKDDLDKLGLSIEVDQWKLDFSHREKNEYFFKIPDELKLFSNIKIDSNTFIPKDFGINNSIKKLGMDVRYISVG